MRSLGDVESDRLGRSCWSGERKFDKCPTRFGATGRQVAFRINAGTARRCTSLHVNLNCRSLTCLPRFTEIEEVKVLRVHGGAFCSGSDAWFGAASAIVTRSYLSRYLEIQDDTEANLQGPGEDSPKLQVCGYHGPGAFMHRELPIEPQSRRASEHRPLIGLNFLTAD